MASDPGNTPLRGSLDSLVQCATVELFLTYGVAVAPMPPRSTWDNTPGPSELTAWVPFEGRGWRGKLALDISEEVLAATLRQSLGAPRAVDWARELTNQLMGRLKNRLLSYQVNLTVGLASAVKGSVVRREKASAPVIGSYPFRTTRGEITVTLQGTVGKGALVYAPIAMGREGDITLF